MYSPLLIAHIIAGMTSLVAGGWIAFTKGDVPNVAAGTFTFYLVSTAWLTMHRRKNVTGRAEVALMVLALVGAAAFYTLGWQRVSGIVRAQLFTDAVRATHLPPVPVLLVVVVTIYWIIRVRFTKTYKPSVARDGAPD